jgi:hypothetical protein
MSAATFSCSPAACANVALNVEEVLGLHIRKISQQCKLDY